MARSSAAGERAEAAGITELRAQLREAVDTIEAIRGGGVDSLVIGLPGREQVFTLASADRTYRLIVEAMSEGAATISPRGVILDVNPRLSLMTGQPGTQLTGASVLDLVPGASRPELARLLDVGPGGSTRGEIELNGPDGTTVPVLLAVGGFDLDGMLLRCLVLTDVTAQRAAEDRSDAALEALREQNTVLEQVQEENRAAAAYNRSLIEASPDPLVTIDPAGAITDVNSATERATGYCRADLLGAEFSDYFTEPDTARAVYEQAFRGGDVRDCPLELRHRDGHTTSVLYNASVYSQPSGRVLGVFAAARDITQIKRAQGALRESEKWLRAVFDNAPVGIEEVSPSGEFVRVNRRFCQITGYTAEELRSRRIQDITHPDDLDASPAGLQRLIAGELNTDAFEKRYLRKDGDVVWAEVSYAAVRDPDGNPVLIVGVARDITAQRAAEAKVGALNAGLEARTTELEQANGSLEAFSYSVSHDLRAPLRTLSGYSEVLLEDYGDRLDETGRGHLDRIQAASERMARLIDDLLQLARVSRVQMNLAPVDLFAEAAAIATELQSRDPGRRVRFTIGDGVRVMADRGLIRTVVQNLIENAWKFTAKDDDAIIEFASTACEDGRVCCYVRDNGAGFDPAYAAKLFKPFERLHPATDFPGTGIGLASVARIVERHGGRVWADGTVGGGATFYFTLAAVQGPP
jgi:PAS domain S-box-containing protein